MTGSELSEVRKNRTLTELNFQEVRTTLIKGTFISAIITPHHFWMSSSVLYIMCIKIKLLFQIY